MHDDLFYKQMGNIYKIFKKGGSCKLKIIESPKKCMKLTVRWIAGEIKASINRSLVTIKNYVTNNIYLIF